MDLSDYSLGESGAEAYNRLTTDRAGTENLGRLMAELTVPSIYPPEGYTSGEDIPGNNQSIGAMCLNTLASILMFLAFPPNQPIFRCEAIEYEVQAAVDEDPKLWAKILLTLSRLEMAHRKRFQTTTLAATYTQYVSVLLVAGNALWKQLKLNSPTFHLPSTYVVQRDRNGNPLLSILKETVTVQGMDRETREWILSLEAFEGLQDQNPWDRTAEVYSICALDTDEGEPVWRYWQELEDGTRIPDTEVTTDFEVPPMWPGWLIPVYGQNWGRGYVEQYRGDLYTVESNSSSANDLAALMAWALATVKSSGSTSIKQVREAKNLSIIPGDAETDIKVFTSEKSADGRFVLEHLANVARRLNAAFLLQSSIQREGERVTAEEIRRLANELDRAMGGLYTQIAVNNQRPIILRNMRLNEEENPKLPPVPKGVEVQVVTGVDAMGMTSEAQTLVEYGTTIKELFPEEKVIDGRDFARRLAAAKGIKTDGLIPTDEQVAADKEEQQQQGMQQMLLEKGTGPAVKGLADAAIAGGPGQVDPNAAPPAQP